MSSAEHPPQMVGVPTVAGVPVSGAAGDQVVQGEPVPYRIDPANADASNISSLRTFSGKRQGNKLILIKKGGELAQQLQKFPEERPWQDKYWILGFCLVLAMGIGICLRYVSSDILQDKGGNDDFPTVTEIVVAGIAGGIASLIVACGYLQMAKFSPACVVWTSLLLGPACCFLFGIYFILLAHWLDTFVLYIISVVPFMLGFVFLALVLCCWRDYVPFMIMLTKVVATVITDNPMTIAVALVGSALGITWALIIGFGMFGAYTEYQQDYHDTPQGLQYFIYFCVALIFTWGGLVAHNIAHVTYCGVFGRWYMGIDEMSRLRMSFRVAVTTSLGSICLGSFMIAFIRAIEMTVRQMRNDAQQDGNTACVVILFAIECIISCIGDFMEYFSEWSYVQVAVRGCKFLDAVRITYSMCTCANMEFVIRDLLLNSVVTLGSLMCGAFGTAAGGAVGYAMGSAEKALAGVIIGLCAGFVSGGTAVGIISSGVKTIMALWAEDPGPLMKSHPEVHKEFHERILGRYTVFVGMS